MSDFDAADYFKKVAERTSASLDPSRMSEKERSVYEATQRTKARLEEIASRRRQNEEETLAGMLGLSPEGVPGTVVNTAAASANDVVKAVSNTAQLPLTAVELANKGTVDEEAWLARELEKRGIASEADKALLDQKSGILGTNREKLIRAEKATQLAQDIDQQVNLDGLTRQDEFTGERQSGVPSRLIGDTAISLTKGAVGAIEIPVGLANLATAGKAGKAAEELGFRSRDAKEFLDSLKTHEQQKADAKVAQADGFVDALKEGVASPSTIYHGVAESLPLMLAGGVIGRGAYLAGVSNKALAGAIGEGVAMTGSAAESIRQQSEDGELSGKQALAALGTGILGTAIARAGGKLSDRAGVGDLEQVAVSGSLPKSQLGGVSRTGVVAGIEGAEEMAQSTGEQILQNYALDKDLSEGVGNAAAMGLLTGTAMGGVLGGAQPRDMEQEKKAEEQRSVEQAVRINDISRFQDKTSKEYNPSKSVLVLQRLAEKGDRKGAEARSEAQAIRDDMDARIKEINQIELINAPENREKVEAKLAEITAQLEGMEEGDARTQLENAVTNIQSKLKSPEELQALQQEKLQQQEFLGKADVILNDWKVQEQSSETRQAEVELADRDITEADDVQKEESRQAVTNTLTLAMRDPDALSAEHIQRLVANDKNALDNNEREFLSLTLASRNAAEELRTKTSKEVHDNIMLGGKGFKGIQRYQKGYNEALERNDVAQARITLAGLESFGQTLQKKLDVFSSALDESLETGKPVYLKPVKHQGWVRTAEKAENGFTVTAGSIPIVERMALETRAVTQAGAAMRAAHKVTLRNQSKAKATPTPKAKPAPQPAAAPKAEAAPAATVTPEAASRMSDAELNDLLGLTSAIDANFSTLDSEMSRREDEAYARMQAEEEAEAADVQAANTPEAEPQANAEEGVEPASEAAQTTPTNTLFKALDRLVEAQHRVRTRGQGQKELQAAQEDVKTLEASAEVQLEPAVAELHQMLVDSTGDVKAADLLPWVKANGSAQMALLMEKLVSHPRIQALKGIGLLAPSPVDGRKQPTGRYHSGDHRISLNLLGRAQERKNLTAEYVATTLVHELVHALSHDVIEDSPELLEQILDLQDVVRDWLNSDASADLNARTRKAMEYMLKNQHEFLTVALTEGDVFETLNQIKAPTGRSVLVEFAAKFILAIKEALGLSVAEKTVLQEVLKLTGDLMENTRVRGEPVGLQNFDAEVAKAEADLLAAAAEREAEEQRIEQERLSAVGFAAPTKFSSNTATSDYAGRTDGKLKLFRKRLPKKLNGKNYKFVNLIAMTMKQVGGRDNEATPRPLVAVDRFISRVKAGEVSLQDFVSRPITESQIPLLSHFLADYDTWAATLKNVLRRPLTKDGKLRNQYLYRDPLQFFLDNDLNMEENVQTALLAAVFSWLSDTVNTPLHRTNEEINAMMGRNKEAQVPRELRELVGKTLGRRSALEFRIGQFATQALGLRLKDSNSPKNELLRLQANLGAHLIDLMVQQGLVEVEAISRNKLNQALGIEAAPDKTKENFLKLKRDGNDQLAEDLEALRSVSKGTGGILASLFGMEAANQMPLLEAPSVLQEDTNKGRQAMPKSIRRDFKKIAQRAYVFRESMDLLTTSTRGFRERIAGIKAVDDKKVHISRRESEQAAMENLTRELDQVEGLWLYLTELGNPFKEFFGLPDYWKNARMGYKNLWANMQSSKIARFLVAPKGWETEVVIDGLPDKNQTDLDNFKLRVMEGMGIKTDATPDALTLATFDKAVQDPVIVAAVEALQSLLQQAPDVRKMTTEMENKVALAVEQMETKLHGYEALLALAHWAEAKRTGANTFTVSLTTEIDGKTNGPMLSMWLLGVIDETFAEMGGFYTEASGVASFGNWKPGKSDLYQSTASSVVDSLNRNNHHPDLMRALYNITGDLVKDGKVTSAGRNLMKNPLTTLIYGSGIQTTISKMADTFVEQMYETIEAIASGEGYGPAREDGTRVVGAEAWALFQEDMQLLTRSRERVFPDTAEQALNSVLSPSAEYMLREMYTDTIGAAVADVIALDLGEYIAARKMIVGQANLVWNIYDDAYRALRIQAIEDLMDSGEIAWRPGTVKGSSVRIPLHELSAAQEKAIQERITAIEPRINTALSAAEGDLSAGIYLAKEKQQVRISDAYTSDALGVVDGVNTNHLSTPVDTVESNPGVSVMANGVQSTDGAIIVQVVAALKAVGVHDAILVSLMEAVEAGKRMNEVTYRTLLSHSLPRESLNSLSRSLKGLVQLAETSPDLADSLLANLPSYKKKLLKSLEIEGDIGFSDLVKMYSRFAYDADFTRLDGLSKLGVVDQYTLEAGVFEVTQRLREEAQGMRDMLDPAIDPDLLLAATRIDQMLKDRKSSKKKPAASPVAQAQVDPESQAEVDEIAQEKGAAKPATTQPPAVQTAPDLVSLLRDTPDLTAGQVIAFLRNSLQKSDSVMDKVYLQILARGARLLKDLPVRYITAETLDQIPPKVRDAQGWYHVDADGAHIGIRGADLAGSAITPELLVHEILHALVAAAVDKAEGIRKTGKGEMDPEILEAVAELKQLQLEVRKALADRPEDLQRFAEALNSESIQEFITWGMTNPAFQRVLKDLQVTGSLAKTKGGRLANLAQKFIQTLARIVFGKNADAQVNGLSVLIARVAVLMETAEVPQVQQAPKSYASRTGNAPLHLDPQQLFEGLAQHGNGYTDRGLEARVAGLMSSVVDAVGGPFQQFYQAAAEGARSASDVVYAAQQAGLMPSTEGLRSQGFVLGEQVAYAIEMLTLALHEAQHDITELAEKELLKLYKEAASNITPADLDADPVRGQAQWDALFGPQAIDPEGRYLSRFAAMALAYPPLANKMGFQTQAVVEKDTTLYGRLVALFQKVMAFLAKAAHKAYAGQQANEKLDVLVHRLVALEAKYRLREESRQRFTLVDKFEDSLNTLGEKARKKVEQFGDSGLFRNRSSAALRLTGETISAVAGQRVPAILSGLEQIYHRSVTGRMGMLASMANELAGTRQSNLWGRVGMNATKLREKLRRDIKTDISKMVTQAFGRELSRNDSEKITQVLLRTGASVLLDQFSLQQIERLLRSPAALKQAIAAQEQLLAGDPFEHYYLNQTKHLGFYLKEGNTRGSNTTPNVELMARLHGTEKAGQVTEAHARSLKKTLEVLTTLHALEYTPDSSKTLVANILAEESQRGNNQNGIEATLRAHQYLIAQAKERVFQGSELLMHHGYVPEIHNPNLQVTVVPHREVAAYKAEGYKEIGEVQEDTTDPSWEPRVLMVLEQAAPRYLSGNFSLTDMKAKGSLQHSGMWNANDGMVNEFNARMTRAILARRKREIEGLFKPQPGMDPSAGPLRMLPTFNANGQVVNHRYTMKHTVRDIELERNSELGHVLGTLAANTFDKETTSAHNERFVQGLKAQWDAESTTATDAYILFGPNSADREVREIYKRLPKETQEQIKQVWGGAGMMVRRDTFDLHFGYRKWGIAQAMEKGSAERNVFEKFISWLAQDLFQLSPKAIRRVTAAENMFEALAKEIKDFLVVKTGMTLLGNVVSNLTLLWAYGVPIKDIWRSHRIALVGALDWHKDSTALRQLETARNSGYVVGSLADLDREIEILKGKLARNPVRETMEAGMMPTIVEDVDAEDDPYSYKSKLQKKTDKWVSKVPSIMRKTAKVAYMTHDTKLYQVLSQGTQLSDYLARYTLFTHLATRKKNPLSKADAAQKAVDAFVNYDIPSHKILQYMNDMGAVRFSKYYMRIQAVLFHLYQENPARMLTLGLVDNYMDGLQSVIDSGVWNQIGNPLEAGPLDYPDAVLQGIPAQALMKLF